MPKNCCVPQCFNNIKNGRAKHFHKFPKNNAITKRWIHVLKMGRKPTKNQVVCSDHFKESDYFMSSYGNKEMLNPGSIPSENIPKTSLEISGVIKTKKHKPRSQRLYAVPDICNTIEVTTSTTISDCNNVDHNGTNAEEVLLDVEHNIIVNSDQTDNTETWLNNLCGSMDVDINSVGSSDLKSSVKMTNKSVTAKPDVQDVGIQVNLPRKRTSYAEISDKDLLYFTGLERERFLILYGMLDKFEPIEDNLFWNKKDALIITMHKCKHNDDFKMMEFIFDLNRKLISEIFTEVIGKLYSVLKKIDIWKMSFKDEKSYRSILDCTEFFVIKADDPNVHQLTFSTYKHHPTFKLLVGCDEMGAVNFISDAFVGSTSDREIVIKSGFIDKLEKGDAILADKGFDVSDLFEQKGVLLNIPPFLRGKEQLSDFEVMKTRIIANRRILIENVNCRAKKKQNFSYSNAEESVASGQPNNICVLCIGKLLQTYQELDQEELPFLVF